MSPSERVCVSCPAPRAATLSWYGWATAPGGALARPTFHPREAIARGGPGPPRFERDRRARGRLRAPRREAGDIACLRHWVECDLQVAVAFGRRSFHGRAVRPATCISVAPPLRGDPAHRRLGSQSLRLRTSPALQTCVPAPAVRCGQPTPDLNRGSLPQALLASEPSLVACAVYRAKNAETVVVVMV